VAVTSGDGYVDPGPRSNGWWTNGDGPRSRRPPIPGGGASLCMYIGNLSYRTDEVRLLFVAKHDVQLVVKYDVALLQIRQYCFHSVTAVYVLKCCDVLQSNRCPSCRFH
jgi:hypothetical protein